MQEASWTILKSAMYGQFDPKAERHQRNVENQFNEFVTLGQRGGEARLMPLERAGNGDG
jgi:hypothetical protein